MAPPGHRAASSPSCSAVALAPAVAARRPTDTRPARSARRPDGSCASPGPSRSSGSRSLPQATSEAMARRRKTLSIQWILGKIHRKPWVFQCCLKINWKIVRNMISFSGFRQTFPSTNSGQHEVFESHMAVQHDGSFRKITAFKLDEN